MVESFVFELKGFANYVMSSTYALLHDRANKYHIIFSIFFVGPSPS